MSNSSTVLLFPCIEKNLGDDLFVKLICEKLPNKTFEVSDRAKYGSLTRINNLRFSRTLTKYLHYTGRVPRNRIKRAIYFLLGKYYGKRMGRHATGVMIVGNAFKNYQPFSFNDTKWFTYRMDLVDKFFLISTNFGPYTDERWRDAFSEYFSRCEDVCFRDNKSFSLFQTLPNVRVAPDAVFSLGRIQRKSDTKTIIVSVIDCQTAGRPQWLQEFKKAYEGKLTETIDLLTEKGYKAVLLNSNELQDEAASEGILCSVRNKDMVSVFHYDGEIEKVIDLYATASGVISTRLHTLVLGLLADIPVFPIIYDEKVAGILESVHFSGLTVAIKDIREIAPEWIMNSLASYTFRLSDVFIRNANEQFSGLVKQIGR